MESKIGRGLPVPIFFCSPCKKRKKAGSHVARSHDQLNDSDSLGVRVPPFLLGDAILLAGLQINPNRLTSVYLEFLRTRSQRLG